MGGQGQPSKKRTHARNASASQRHAGVSDYDSDAHAQHPPPLNPALLTRTNTELNLSVLRRYIPVQTILSIAANAVVYTFAPETSSWERTGAEGTYFLCFLPVEPAPGGAAPAAAHNACIFILNRRGLQNTVLDLSKVQNFEVMNEIYIFKLEDDSDDVGGAEAGTDKTVVGIWIHAQDAEARAENAAMIQEALRIVQDGKQQTAAAAPPAPAPVEVGGKQISVSDLFTSHNAGSL